MSSEIYDGISGICATLRDNRTIARGSTSKILAYVDGIQPPWYLEVAIPNLNRIDAILDINIRTVSPKACPYGIADITIGRNEQGQPVVGFTVCDMTFIGIGNTATGVTVTSDVVCVGF
jgi:hypothetical protein